MFERFVLNLLSIFDVSKTFMIGCFVLGECFCTSTSVWMLMLTLFVISAVSSASAARVFPSGIIIVFDSDRGDICVFIDKRIGIDLFGLIYVTV